MELESVFATRDVILQNIIQNEKLNIEFVLDELVMLNNAHVGTFFEMVSQESDKLICKVTTSRKYKVEQVYSFDDFAQQEKQFVIFYKSAIIGLFVFDSGNGIDNLENSFRQNLQNTICIGLVLNKIKHSNVQLNQLWFTEIANLINNVMDSNNKLPPKLQSIQTDNIDRILELMNDVAAFLQLESNEIVIKNEQCHVASLLQEIGASVNQGVRVRNAIDKRMPEFVYIDQEQVINILVTLVNKLGQFSPITITTSFEGGVGSMKDFLIFIITSASVSRKSNFSNVFSDERYNINQINMMLIKGLCERMAGTCDVEAENIVVKLRCTSSPLG